MVSEKGPLPDFSSDKVGGIVTTSIFSSPVE
jgi:hypothetical protein